MAQNSMGQPVVVTNGPSAPISTSVSDGAGGTATALPPGRANATASVPVVLSNEDYARVSQTYRRSAAVGATAGDGVLVTGVTTAGTVNFTLVNGGSIVISVPLGSSNWPYAVTAASLGTAVGGTFSSLFFT